MDRLICLIRPCTSVIYKNKVNDMVVSLPKFMRNKV